MDRTVVAGTDRHRSRKFAFHLQRIPLLLYGVLFLCFGISTYLFGVLLVLPRYLLALDAVLLPISEWIVWYSGVPIVAGLVLALTDLFFLLDRRRRPGGVRCDLLTNPHVTVALTAYNDEDSISRAVWDFRSHPLVRRVIVVSNNSSDETVAQAKSAGAIVIDEKLQGYGRCVFRCLTEAAQYDDTDLIVLCEGDLTFRARDIDKLVAYASHADIVNGTRIVEQLRERETQLSVFMFYGNLFVGKLLEYKHLGKGTFTDVGTTYKLCHRSALTRLLPQLDPAVNLEFNAHFLDVALASDFELVECPITFYGRIGTSKGGNLNDRRALEVGLRMIVGLLFGWKYLAHE